MWLKTICDKCNKLNFQICEQGHKTFINNDKNVFTESFCKDKRRFNNENDNRSIITLLILDTGYGSIEFTVEHSGSFDKIIVASECNVERGAEIVNLLEKNKKSWFFERFFSLFDFLPDFIIDKMFQSGKVKEGYTMVCHAGDIVHPPSKPFLNDSKLIGCYKDKSRILVYNQAFQQAGGNADKFFVDKMLMFDDSNRFFKKEEGYWE